MVNMFGQATGPEIVLKKYPNRRIYDPTRNCHVTLSELANRVKTGERIRIVDNQTGEDITSSIMGQVLYETLKTRPDYLPLDLVILMIRAQDNVVRDFLFNGLPQAFQMYIEAQRRMMSGMTWMNQPFSPPFGGFPSFFGQKPQQQQDSEPARPAQDTDQLREELNRLREEIDAMKQIAPQKPVKRKKEVSI